MAIKTDFASFGMLMEAAVIRQVPLYQRRYSWQRKQIEALWSDILRLYIARHESDGLRHFIGPLILGEGRPRGGLLPNVMQIIDGQQRLMTLSLMICAIRDHLADDESVDVINDKYLEIRQGNSDPELRLLPGQWDHDSYVEAIEGVDEFTYPQSAVACAYEIIVDLLARGPGSELEPSEDSTDPIEEDSSADWGDRVSEEAADDIANIFDLWDVNKLVAAITEDLELAIVSDVPEDRAYEIFETLNASGMPLSQVDLVRNMIFVNTPTRAVELYQQIWEPMEGALGPSGLDAYLHCWIMVQGYNVSRKNTYSALVDKLKETGRGEEVFESFLSQIGDEHAFYLVASEPKSPLAQTQIRRSSQLTSDLEGGLTRLDEWGSVPLEPVLFLTVQKAAQGSIEPPGAVRLLDAIESLVVRRYICGVPPNDLRSSFARMAREIASLDGSDFLNAAMHELNDTGRRWPTDNEVKEACKGTALYRNRPFQCFFVLRRLAQHLGGREVPAMPFGIGVNDWSVEHLMPQTLSTEWKKDLKSWGCRDPIQFNAEVGNTLGNLTITAYNADLSNAPFAEKQRRLRERKHRLALSDDFLDANRWAAREVANRSNKLAREVLKVWPRVRN